MTTKSVLYASWCGPENGPTTLCFGGFLDEIADVTAFATFHLPHARNLCVRGPRAQTQGGNGVSCGHFWYIGPQDRPELSTFGDGLYQAEILLLEQAENGPVYLAGRGQGASIALTLAALWPDHVASVSAWQGGLPLNLDRMPLEFGDLSTLSVALHDLPADIARFTREQLAAQGAHI